MPEHPSRPLDRADNRSTIPPCFIELTEDEFLKRFKPIPNPISDDAGFDFGEGCCLFTAHGADLDFVRGQPLDKVWTIIDGDDGLEIAGGMHIVNRLGYLVTEQPCPPDHMISVPLDM